ncbi:hypothetical protein [Pyxidicoccus xibeiensis]|uniref:hypothetical protein n=1 Tax=Pyxidicoccus xibeiensis TaxID=2906759 RepID=UPI0020A6F982|nr:hypothetical protein [Pyxidicoccus xibeiensis]MCP3140002.1 hypothetical protein [Pyxidicoccus xibeiensis]
MRLSLSLLLLAVLSLSACAARPRAPEVEQASRQEFPFVRLPSKPRDCAFEVFEERQPPRPYTVVGVLPVSVNMWLSPKRRKALLRDTACRSGSDAVLLPKPAERTVGDIQVREYQAVFVAWSDGSAPVVEAPPASAPDEDVVVVPIGEEFLGDTEGTQVRPVSPEDDAYWE